MTRRAAWIVSGALVATAGIFALYALGIIPTVSSDRVFDALWIGWIAAFAAIEAVALIRDAQGDTLSEHFRLWFRTDTKLGRSIWLWLSGGFVAWFVIPHIALKLA